MTPSRLADAERELNDLRARAYGPKSDIEADPVAVARLVELEAAHVGAAMPVNDTESVGSREADASPTAPRARESVAADPPTPIIPTPSRDSHKRSPWRRATATPNRAWFVVAAASVLGILIYAATWLFSPHPDATLQPTAVHLGNQVIRTLNAYGEDPDISTLRQFEPYHDVNVWSVESSLDNTCLIGYDSVGGGRFEFECLPPGMELALHMNVLAESNDGFGEWLPDGSVISLHLRKDTVDVFVHSPPATP